MISPLRKQRNEDQKFRVILRYRVTVRPARGYLRQTDRDRYQDQKEINHTVGAH